MRVVYNNIIPVQGFKAINILGVLFVRKGETLSEQDMNHEQIHTAQIKELLYLFFYILYLIEFLFRCFMPGNAYRNISFEREAYANQHNGHYLETRRKFNFLHYIKLRQQ